MDQNLSLFLPPRYRVLSPDVYKRQEDGTEFLQRVKSVLTGGDAVLPMATSCSPGWVKFIENNFPDQLEHLSTCKSTHMMMGAVLKSYYAKKIGKHQEELYVV